MHARRAVILAVDEGAVLLVEPISRAARASAASNCPLGLVGDEEDGESAETSAARELEEETGYRPAQVETIGYFYSSPGMVSEGFTLVRATGLTKVSDGGGNGDEDITVHRVPLSGIVDFVAAKRAEGVAIDVRMLLLLSPSILG